MKKLIYFLGLIFVLVSCQNVDSGHEGVGVDWGGKTDMTQVYGEGMHTGVRWLWDDIVPYDIRQKTITKKFTFNDKRDMVCPVEFSLDYSIMKGKSNYIHSEIGLDQLNIKILTTLSSAAKQVVPKYSASELNLSKREEAEQLASNLLEVELAEFYVNFGRIRITDVDIPEAISSAAEDNARQEQLNKLALLKAQEEENKFQAAEWEAKTKDILSQPAMLKLKELEIELEWAKKGVSRYGTNNVFGAETSVLKGLK